MRGWGQSDYETILWAKIFITDAAKSPLPTADEILQVVSGQIIFRDKKTTSTDRSVVPFTLLLVLQTVPTRPAANQTLVSLSVKGLLDFASDSSFGLSKVFERCCAWLGWLGPCQVRSQKWSAADEVRLQILNPNKLKVTSVDGESQTPLAPA